MLRQELDSWADSGDSASFWWRDDDAGEETAQLHRLDALSQEFEVPVSVAVIPARLQDSLPRYLQIRQHFSVLQHGYAHSSFAAKGSKKIEIGGDRSTATIQSELSAGFQQLSSVFEGQFVPVLVPPWNRIESRTYRALAGAGFSGLSSMWARATAYPLEGLLQVNTHLDPVNWRHDRSFIGEAPALAQLRDHLYARRTELPDGAEPTGILTHHLSQTDEVWAFVRALLKMLHRHPAVRWLNAKEIWGTQGNNA